MKTCSYCGSDWKEDKYGGCSRCGAPGKSAILTKSDFMDFGEYVVCRIDDPMQMSMIFKFYRGRNHEGDVRISYQEVCEWPMGIDPTDMIVERFKQKYAI